MTQRVLLILSCLCVTVFKVKVLGVTESYYDKYDMEITQLIKLGQSVIFPQLIKKKRL